MGESKACDDLSTDPRTEHDDLEAWIRETTEGSVLERDRAEIRGCEYCAGIGGDKRTKIGDLLYEEEETATKCVFITESNPKDGIGSSESLILKNQTPYAWKCLAKKLAFGLPTPECNQTREFFRSPTRKAIKKQSKPP